MTCIETRNFIVAEAKKVDITRRFGFYRWMIRIEKAK
jgi:hypothetical protein